MAFPACVLLRLTAALSIAAATTFLSDRAIAAGAAYRRHDIDVGKLVLAQEKPTDGWWEFALSVQI